MAKQYPDAATGLTKSGLQVIGAGLPRTSTASLQTALELLGFGPCYHTITALIPNHRTHGPLWLAAMREPSSPVRQKILAEVMKGYNAIVDAPGCFFIADWVEMYPETKFVLGLRRSPKIWLNSFNGSVGKVFGWGVMYWLGYFVPELYLAFRLNNLWEEQTRERYGVGVKTEEYYRLHREWVRSVVPKERLLEFQASDGWEPLVKFFGREAPAGQFPHTNDAKATNGLIRTFVIYGVGVWVGVLVCGWLIMRGLMMHLAIDEFWGYAEHVIT